MTELNLCWKTLIRLNKNCVSSGSPYYYYYYYYYYYHARIWLKCHKILGLQEHFTVRRTRLESSMIQRMSKEEQNCQTQSGPTGQNIVRRVVIWDAAWRQSVTSTRWRYTADWCIHAKPWPKMRDRQWLTIDHNRRSHRRYNECRCRRRPQTPSRVYVCHSVEFISEIWRSLRM